MSITYNPALTTTFTAPAACRSHWTYEGSHYNSVWGGLLIQNALTARPDSGCFPPGYNDTGRVPYNTAIYSPGVCPSGYATAANTFNGQTTTAVCCPGAFSYYQTYSRVDNGDSSATFQGCISAYDGRAPPTTVYARSSDNDLNTTAVSGPITMWAQPITVAFQQADLTLWTTRTVSAAQSASLVTSSPTSSVPVAATAVTTALASATSTSTPVPVVTPAHDTSLSAGTIAGIAIGATAVLTAIIGLILFFRRRRTTTTAAQEQPPVSNWMDYQPHAAVVHEKPVPQHYISTELDGNWRGHEMPEKTNGKGPLIELG